MCRLLCEAGWTGPAARDECDHVQEAFGHGLRAEEADRMHDPDLARDEATKAAHAGRQMLQKFGLPHVLAGILGPLIAQEFKMATDSDPTHNLVDDLLAEMAAQPATRLLITSENWGWWGRRPISYGIIERWLINGFFVRASDTSKNLWDLSDRARDYLAGKIPRSEIKWPEGKRYVPPPPKFADESGENAARPATTPRPAADLRTFSEADELFTDSGVCRLCGKVSHVFGMISHAKSKHGATYEDTGEVQLVTRRKKTVAIILGGAPASVPVGADATPAAKAPTAPKSKPAPKPAGPIDLGGDITQMSPDEILRRLGVKK